MRSWEGELNATDTKRSVSAYGVTLSGPRFPDRFLAPQPDWPTWQVRVEAQSGPLPDELWTARRATFHMRPHGATVVDRDAHTTTLILPEPPADEAFAHPLLGFSALAIAAWSGYATFHAGAVLIGGRAWLVTGEAGAGKSSVLAWLALHGFDVLADDLAVCRSGHVFAGPRCIDLRQGAAEHFGAGEDVGVLGLRRRWRIGLATAPAEVRIGGWVCPRWSPAAIAVERLSPPEQLAMMASVRGMLWGEPAHEHLMPLLATPAYTFDRPQDFHRMDEAMNQLISRLEGRS